MAVIIRFVLVVALTTVIVTALYLLWGLVTHTEVVFTWFGTPVWRFEP